MARVLSNFVIEGVAVSCQLEETASHSSITNFLSAYGMYFQLRASTNVCATQTCTHHTNVATKVLKWDEIVSKRTCLLMLIYVHCYRFISAFWQKFMKCHVHSDRILLKRRSQPTVSCKVLQGQVLLQKCLLYVCIFGMYRISLNNVLS